jgi:hypothetical protein
VVLVTATDATEALRVRTAASYYKGTAAHELTVRTLDSAGEPADGGMPIHALKLDGGLPNDPFLQQWTWGWSDAEGVAHLQVAGGRYDVYGAVTEYDVVSRRTTVMAEPELTITGDTTVVLDSRRGVPIRPTMPERTDVLSLAYGTLRGFDGGEFTHGYLFDFEDWGYYVTPTKPVTTGWMEAYERWRFGSRLITAKVSTNSRHGPDGHGHARPLQVAYRTFYAGPALAGDRSLPFVFAGDGTPDELARAGVRGKAVLVRIRIPEGEPFRMGYAWNAAQRVTADAVAAGAAAVLPYVDVPGALVIDGLPSERVPQLSVSWADGERLRAQLPGRLTLSGRQNPERIYQLRYRNEGFVPDRYDRRVDLRDLVKIDARYHSDLPNQGYLASWPAFSSREQFQTGLASPFWAPAEWTEYVGPTSDPDIHWLRTTTQTTGGRDLGYPQASLQSRDRFRPGQRPFSERWFEAPLTHGGAEVPDGYAAELRCTFCRQGEFFFPGFHYLDSDPRHYLQSFVATSQYRLLRDGVELRREGSTSNPRWRLPADRGVYRLEAVDTQPLGQDVRPLAPRVSTAWTFASSPPAAGAKPDGYTCPLANSTAGCAFQPLIQLRYRLGLDLLNSARAGRHFSFELTARPHREAPYSARTAGVRVWTSVDDGASWQPALAHRSGAGQSGGEFRVHVLHPPRHRTNGFVWLRAEAWDTAGNRVEQTVERAYSLR